MLNAIFFFIFGNIEKFSDHCKLRGGVYFVDALETTPSGKVLRRKAREYAIEMYNKYKA